MNCAQRTGVCALLISFSFFSNTTGVFAKSEKDHATVASSASPTSFPDEFKWNESRKLSWNDFRGPINATSEESAAATNCGIGFRTSMGANGKPQITVYNTFYAKRSWVRPDAKIQEILNHEQGHFDLCEIYTRKLRQRMNNFNFDIADPATALMNIYTQVRNEYESRQQSYEEETTHGTIIPIQQKWQDMITKELTVVSQSMASN